MGDEKEQIPGIQQFFTALVYQTRDDSLEDSRDVFQADVPSLYAEARMGVASYSEVKKELAKAVEKVKRGRYNGKLPYFEKWIKENKGKLEISDLEELLIKENKSSAMIRERAVDKAGESELGTLVARVKGRTTGVDKNTLKYWDVELSNYVLDEDFNPTFRRNCQCGFKGKHTNKRKLWDQSKENERHFLDDLLGERLTTKKELGKELHIACYHEAAAITEMELQNNRGKARTIRNLQSPTTIAFDFIDRWDLVFESFARRYKYKQLYGQIDEFLFKHDIVSPYFKKLMSEGKVSKEVVKKSRHFETMPGRIIRGLHKVLLKNGFKYNGFAWDFKDVGNRNKNYETMGIVYDNPSKDTSYHVVYDKTFFLPFIVKKEFLHFGKDRKPTRYQLNPLNLLFNKDRRDHIYEIDDRTGKLAKVSIVEPDQVARKVYGARNQYRKYREGFLRAQK